MQKKVPYINIIVTALFFFLSNGGPFIWPLAWLSPLPLLLLLPYLSKRKTFIYTFLSYLLGLTIYLYTLKNTMPPTVVILTIVLFAFLFASIFTITKLLTNRINPVLGVFVFPTLWTLAEYLVLGFSSNGNWGSIANSQTDFIRIIQIVSITGNSGLVFFLSLFPSLLAFLWIQRKNRLTLFKISVIPMIVLALPLYYGVNRISRDIPGNSIAVGVYATDKDLKYFKTKDPFNAISVIKKYNSKIKKLREKGAEVILFPEKTIGLTNMYRDQIFYLLSKSAKENNVMIIIGLNDKGYKLRKNSAWVISNKGELLLNHAKRNLVPGWETGKYIKGERPGIFHVNKSKWGVIICKDNDFPKLAREYGNKETAIVFAPTWDFINDATYHLRLAILRSVENGYTLVRSTKQGISTVSNEYGIIQEYQNTYENDVSFVVNVPEGSSNTFYTKYGDWFIYICFTLLIVMIGLYLKKEKR